MNAAPVSYRDPYWRELAANAEAQHGVADGLLQSILLHGERTNADRVSSAGARTPFQIIPETRQQILKKYGIDPYLSPENAAEGAALLLKESLDRNGGDPILAAGEYHGGPDRSNWGPINAAYRERVAKGMAELSGLSARLDAAATASLTPERAQSLRSLPEGYEWEGQAAAPQQSSAPPAVALPDGFEWELENSAQPAEPAAPQDLPGYMQMPGNIPASSTPYGPDPAPATRNAPTPRMPEAGRPFVPNEYLHWRDMPELNQLSMAGAKTGIGAALAEDPAEALQIVQANFPGVQSRETPEGTILTSGIDGREYAIPSGFSRRDIPSTVAKIGAFIPSGMVAGIGGGAAATAATDAALQGAKQWAGGREIDPRQVAVSGAIGGAAPLVAPLVAKGVKAAGRGFSNMEERLRPLLANPKTPIGAAAQPVAPVTGAVDDVAVQVAGAADNVALRAPTMRPSGPLAYQPTGAAPRERQPLPSAPAGIHRDPPSSTARAVPMGVDKPPPAPPSQPAAATVAAKIGDEYHVNPDDLAELMRAAADGDGKASQRLATLMDRDPHIVEAARALGFGEDDLPLDFFLASRSAREIIQLAKSQKGSLLKEQEVRALEQVGLRAEKLLDDLGGSRDLSALDANVRESIIGTIKDMTRNAEDLYASVEKAIPTESRFPATNLRAWLSGEAERLGGFDKLDGIEARLYRRFQDDPSYGYLDRMRRELGAAMERRVENAYSSMEDGIRKQLYKALQTDQEMAAQTVGVLDQYRAATAAARSYKYLQRSITSLFGRDLGGSMIGKLESGVKGLQAGDVSRMVKVLKHVPHEMRQEVVASGLNAAFNRSFRNGQMSFKAFADWFEGLERNRHALSLVMSNLPEESRGQLVSLARLSRGIAKSTALYSTTGASLQMAIRENLTKADGLITSLVGLAKRSSVALVAEPIAQAMGVPGAGLTAALVNGLAKGKPQVLKEVDQLISSPEFLHLVRQIGKPGEEAAIRAVAKKSLFSKIFGTVGENRSAADRARWLRDQLHQQQK